MGLNIKNREVHLMAEELSKLTGESMKTAVTIALRERLARVRQEQGLSLADRLLAIGRDCASRPTRHPARWINDRTASAVMSQICHSSLHRSE
jgi:antitoxin VapB